MIAASAEGFGPADSGVNDGYDVGVGGKDG